MFSQKTVLDLFSTINSIYKQNVLTLFPTSSFLANLGTILDVVIVAVIIYLLLTFFRGTKAFNILIGLFVLGAVSVLSQYLNLVTLSWILRYTITVLVISIPIVFQPELRNALDKLGRNPVVNAQSFFNSKKSFDRDEIISEITRACLSLAKSKHGALIVFEKETGLLDYIKTGIQINGQISASLIQSIFYPKSPLHDGAVIIQKDILKAASCTLPITDKKLTGVGLRHKAAIGISEETDCMVILISEEKGEIYKVSNKRISDPLNEERLARALYSLYPEKKPGFSFESFKKNLNDFFKI